MPPPRASSSSPAALATTPPSVGREAIVPVVAMRTTVGCSVVGRQGFAGVSRRESAAGRPVGRSAALAAPESDTSTEVAQAQLG
jgi:hypothetical protein